MSGRLRYKPAETLRQMWYADGTRWGELLLASIKIALGFGILLSLGSPVVLARYGAPWTVVGALLGVYSLVVAVVQVVGVLYQSYFMRQMALTLGWFMWVFYAGITLVLGGSLQGILLFIPLVAANMLISRKLVLSQRVVAAVKGKDA